jgi:predicted GIY-YIG superfamily endonuclease
MSAATHLYRHFDAAGRLLYIGSTSSVKRRNAQHQSGSEWFTNRGEHDRGDIPVAERRCRRRSDGD